MSCLSVLIWASIGSPNAAELPAFPSGSVWRAPVIESKVHPDSELMISTLHKLGGFGNGRMQIDFSLHVNVADRTAPIWAVIPHPDGYYSPDCDLLDMGVPMPPGSAIEGTDDLECNRGDCHLIVVQGDHLYELYRAGEAGQNQLQTQCLVKWDLGRAYPAEGRGEHCTSADGAGFPIAPLLLNADEIASSLRSDPKGNGDVGHAIRFILPNSRIASDPLLRGVRDRLYVRPASHAGAPRGPPQSVPYGARLRLRSTFSLSGYPPAARVILNTMKRYGIVLADGGRIALTAQSDRNTDTTWSSLGIHSRVFDRTFGALDVSVLDFKVLDTGPRIAETYDCQRAPG